MRTERLKRLGRRQPEAAMRRDHADQTDPAEKEKPNPQGEKILEEILRKENLYEALRRVRSNKGAAGIDGMTVDELPEFLKAHWPLIRSKIRSGTYKPRPVRRIDIPKPAGGTRMLGIPCVLDRFIQQAMLQILGPIFDPGFSEHSYGFRPGRSALQAVNQARSFIDQGYRWVVDLDLEKFFDQVNHDILMSLIARKIKDKMVLKLIRSYLSNGIMDGGIGSQREKGTPQGSPLSPMLSNVLLDVFDKELEKRNHRFCRYADDSNVYVASRKAGDRVLGSLTRFLERKLKLKVNRSKSAVDRPWNRKFLGYSVTNHKKPRLKPAMPSVKRAKDRVREITHSGRGQNIRKVIERLNRFTRGWSQYYRLSEVKLVFQDLDKWIRRRLRKILWEQWKTPRTRYRKMVQFGVEPRRAKKATAGGRGAWFNAGASHMHAAITNARLGSWGLMSISNILFQLKRKDDSNRRVRTRTHGGVGRRRG